MIGISWKGYMGMKKALPKSVRELPDEVSVEKLIVRVLQLGTMEKDLEQPTKAEMVAADGAEYKLVRIDECIWSAKGTVRFSTRGRTWN